MSRQSDLAKSRADNRKSNNKEFAQRLDARREELNLKKVELARFCNVESVTVTYWCNGTVKPNSDNMDRLALVLKTTTDYLKDGKTYADSHKFNGIDPDILETAVKIVRQSEIFSGQMYSAEALGSKVLEMCYRLPNNAAVEVIPECNPAKKAIMRFTDELKKLADNGRIDERTYNSMLNNVAVAGNC